MPINQFVKPESPIAAIASALKVAESVYGIKGAALAGEKLERENKVAADAQDPGSDYSKTRQAAAGAGVAALVKKGTISQEQASPLLEGIKNASGASLDKLTETSPLFQMAKSDGLLALANARMMNGQEKNELGANKDYASTMKPYEGTIQAANRVDALINQVKTGQLKSTQTFRNDLNSAVGQMFNNGKAATVYGMSHADQGSLFGRIQNSVNYMTGSAGDTIPAAQLDQLQKDVHALRDEYANAHETTYQSFKEGIPDRLRPKLEARYNSFRRQAVDPFMKTQDDSGNSPAVAGGSGGGVPGVANANAGEVQAPAPHVTMDQIDAELQRRSKGKKNGP